MARYGTVHLLFFTITLFISASLLFLVQPMFAKMVLPLLGGTPAVWNTCMVFFQAALLTGYVYAHATTAWLGVRRQALLHVGVLLLPLLVLPIGVPMGWSAPVEGRPILWLLGLLGVSVGLPFFVVSASAPMLQKWFADTGHRSAKDPYFLYGASNLGSLLALVGYPLLMEPRLRLAEQGWVWAGGYGLLVVLILGCAMLLWRSSVERRILGESMEGQGELLRVAGLTVGRRVRWVALSFVPSSLMLGVTTHLSTDITPIPLLWVIPLAIYLLTFVLVFAKRAILPHQLMVRRFPFLILAAAITIFSQATQPVWLLILLHLLAFFVAAMVCHGEQAKDRPPPGHLTEFYLWMSVGGVLGGLFNALVAPLMFKTVAEYPLAMVAACLLRPSAGSEEQRPLSRWLDFLLPLTLGIITAGLVWGLQGSDLRGGQLTHILIFGLSAVVCLSFAYRPIRFGLGVGAIMLGTMFYTGPFGRVLHTERSFFGVTRIMLDLEEKYIFLVHGNTNHGAQSLDPARRLEPLSYYYRTGPGGQVFAAFSGKAAKRRVAVIGLGTGSMACYGESGQHWTFYEIDPVVERVARDPKYFTFLRECPPMIDVILGDARVSLRKAPDRHYGLIVLDAFSSDAIPIHLLTREAIQLYLTKLADGGILLFHISNRSLNLQPVVANLAEDMGLVFLVQNDLEVSEIEVKSGKEASTWVVMARKPSDLRGLAQDPRWKPLDGLPAAVWTDDFSNILSVFNWN
ncbi:MAG: spermidine synthase [Candidatus Binatia bacterium]